MSSPEAVAGKASGATPEPLVIQHAPMSERQQLALIKRLEKDAQNQSNSGKIFNILKIDIYRLVIVVFLKLFGWLWLTHLHLL